MCLILLAHDVHPRYALVLAANRDEFHERPTAPAAPWPGARRVIAGRDLRAGGTWLGVGEEGRWAALTNVRAMDGAPPGAPSRGWLVAEYLQGVEPAEEFAARVAAGAARYAGFNLLVGGVAGAYWVGRGGSGPVALRPGVHGISNADLNTPWPKVERGTRELEKLMASGDPDPDRLLDLLLDRAAAPDGQLPSTVADLELERALSATFIDTPAYGTRSSTALLVERDGAALLVERTFEPGGASWSEVRHRLTPADPHPDHRDGAPA